MIEMKSIVEIKKYHEDCTVICRGNPEFIEVLYSSGTNQMSLPHTVATYSFANGEWERDD